MQISLPLGGSILSENGCSQRIMDGRDSEKVIDQLLSELEVEYPDPVDQFEDKLAASLGLVRMPNCPQREWREIRVCFINEMTGNDH